MELKKGQKRHHKDIRFLAKDIRVFLTLQIKGINLSM